MLRPLDVAIFRAFSALPQVMAWPAVPRNIGCAGADKRWAPATSRPFVNLLKLFSAASLAAVSPACSTGRPPALLSPSTPAADLRQLKTYISRAGNFGFSGVTLTTSGDSVVVEQAAGFADIARSVPNSPRTLFDVGSLAKQFTAVAILKLEEEGHLSTKDHLGRFFPQIEPALAPLTLHQLLTHSSGLPWDVEDPRAPLTRDQFFEEMRKLKLISPAGQRFSYSNVGYTLLAAVVEEVSGRSFEEFLATSLFYPAKMQATGYLTGNPPGYFAARGYLAGEDRGYPWQAADNIDGRPSWNGGIGAGGIVSNVRDLERWARALQSGRILSTASLEKLFGCHIPTGEGQQCYGYGWNVETEAGRRVVWHDGSNGAFWARLTLYPKEDLVAVVLSNKSIQPAWTVDAAVRQSVFAKEVVELPPAAQRLAAADAARLAGHYDFAAAIKFSIEPVGGELFLEPRTEAALDFVNPLPEGHRDAAARRSALAREFLDAAASGDYEPLRRAAASDAAYQAIRDDLEYLRSIGPRAEGFKEFSTIGTTLSSKLLATYGEAVFGKGEAPFRILWEGDRVAGVLVQTAASVSPPRFAIAKGLDGNYVGYNLSLRRAIGISQTGKAGLVLAMENRQIAAVRR